MTDPAAAKWDRWSFVILATIVLAYVILRAAMVPWIHDESTSMFWYCERGEFLPYASLWDAGNHFLSTAIGVLAYQLWDLSLLGSRIGSVLAFLIYAFAAFRIGSMVHDRAVRWMCWAALMLCPFLLDFFSLFRGYGLGMAFWLLAIDGGLRYFRSGLNRHLLQLLLGLFIADMAVLSLVPLWALIVGVIGMQLIVQWRKSVAFPWRKSLIWALAGVLPLLFGLLLAWELRRRGLLYHGTTEGFIPITLSSLSTYVLGSDHPLILILVSLAIVAATLVILISYRRSSLLMVVALLLWTDVLMRIAMAWILGVNYPEDRAALHMVPLVVLILVLAADALSFGYKWASRLFVVLLAFLPLRTIFTANLDHTQLWPEQSIPTRFLHQIAALQQESDRPLLVGVYHQLGYALPYAARVNDIPLGPPDVKEFPFGEHDIKVADDRFLADARQGYTIVDHSPGTGLHLLVRNEPLDLRSSEWIEFNTSVPDAEFLNVWEAGAVDLNGDVLVEVNCRLDANVEFLNVDLVVSQKLHGEAVYYHNTPLAQSRAEWSGEELHWIMRMPYMQADERIVYFWNQDQVPMSIADARVRVHTPTPRDN